MKAGCVIFARNGILLGHDRRSTAEPALLQRDRVNIRRARCGDEL